MFFLFWLLPELPKKARVNNDPRTRPLFDRSNFPYVRVGMRRASMAARETGANEGPVFNVHDLDEETIWKVPIFLRLFQSPTRNHNPFR